MRCIIVRKNKGYILGSCAALLLLMSLCVAALLLQAGLQQRSLSQQQQNFHTRQALSLAVASAQALLQQAAAQKPAYYYLSPQHEKLALLGWHAPQHAGARHAEALWLDYCAFSRHRHAADHGFLPQQPQLSPEHSAAQALQQFFELQAYAEWRYMTLKGGRQLRYCWYIEDQQGKYNLQELATRPRLLHELLGEALQLNREQSKRLAASLQRQGSCENWPLLQQQIGKAALQELRRQANWSYPAYALPQFIPCHPMLARSCWQKHKLALGELLELQDVALQQQLLCSHLQDSLQNFGLRGGALPPQAYLQNISANLLDLLDEDKLPRCGENYRGLEALPFVSELFINYRWNSSSSDEKFGYALLDVDIYAELHQWAQQPFEGELEFGALLPWKYLSSGISRRLDDTKLLSPQSRQNLREEQGLWWSRPFKLSLQPGEYKVCKLMQLQLRLPLAKAGQKLPSPLQLSLQKNRYIRYALSHGKQIYDSSGKGVFQSELVLHAPPAKNAKNQSMRCNESAHSLGTYGKLLGNSGDERISFYLQEVQSSNQWPDNASPFRRNVRRKLFNAAALPPRYSYVNVSCWPDGGLDSPCRQSPPLKDAHLLEPDNAYWQNNASGQIYQPRLLLPAELEPLAPLSLCYDPLLWNPQTTNDGLITLSSQSDRAAGGGNSLRLARREHQRFEHTPQQAALLLDVLNPYLQAATRGANWREMRSQINLNSCNAQVLQSLLQHAFAEQQGQMALRGGKFSSWNKVEATRRAARTAPKPSLQELAEQLMDKRPLRSLAELAELFGSFDPTEQQHMAFAHYHEHRLERLLATSCLYGDNYRIYAVAELLDSRGKVLKRFLHAGECGSNTSPALEP